MTARHTTSWLVALAVMLATGMTAQAALVGYWQFESDLTSEVGGSGLTASVGAGTPDAGTLGGQVGKCLHLYDVDNEFIKLPTGYGNASGSGASLGDSFTISAWYNLQPVQGNGSARFFVYEGSDSYNLVSYGVKDTDGDSTIDDGQAYIAPGISQNYANAATQNNWHHVLATFDASGGTTTVQYWIDGVKQASTMSTTTSGKGAPAIHVGDARAGTTDRDWDGLIDEVAVWDHKLSDAEALNVYTRGSNGQSIIPEPTSLALMGIIGLCSLRRKRG